MYGAFVKLLNMSAASAILIGVVLVLRMVFRKLPKKYLCVLWLFVALRLCCPFMLSSSLSVFNHIGAYHNGQLEYVRYNEKTEKPTLEIPAAMLQRAGDGPTVTFFAAKLYLPTVMTLWSIGAALMLLYAAVSFLHIQRRTRERILYRGNIYLCDRVPSPFVLGLVKPKIYLPSDIAEEQINCVIAHERTHIRRGDHWWKSLGFLLLSIHWFNPMVWVGYLFFCRDMELACDEAVISALDAAQKQTYSRALLACSMPRGFITACPLAFGEIGVKQRIKSILNYREPAKYAFGAALAICLVLAAVFLTNPVRVGDYMKVTSYESNTFGEQGASIQLHTGTFVQNVTIHAELWENGTCTQSIPLTLPADTKKCSLLSSTSSAMQAPLPSALRFWPSHPPGKKAMVPLSFCRSRAICWTAWIGRVIRPSICPKTPKFCSAPCSSTTATAASSSSRSTIRILGTAPTGFKSRNVPFSFGCPPSKQNIRLSAFHETEPPASA